MPTKLRLTPSKAHTVAKSKKRGSYVRESEMQRTVMDWAKWSISKYPELALIFAIPNGAVAGPGRYATVNWMKSLGMRNGVPDIFLPVPRYFGDAVIPGLFLELKSRDGVVAPEQTWWIERLRERGYRVEICYSDKEAIKAIKQYLEE